MEDGARKTSRGLPALLLLLGPSVFSRIDHQPSPINSPSLRMCELSEGPLIEKSMALSPSLNKSDPESLSPTFITNF